MPLGILIPAPKGRPHTETYRVAAIFKLFFPFCFFFPFIFVMLHAPGLQKSRGSGLSMHRQPHPSCDNRAGRECATWSHRLEIPAHGQGLSWRSGAISAFLHPFVLWLFHETSKQFPKRLSICSGSRPYFASSQSSGSEAAAVSPPAPGPTTSSPRPVPEVGLSS